MYDSILCVQGYVLYSVSYNTTAVLDGLMNLRYQRLHLQCGTSISAHPAARSTDIRYYQILRSSKFFSVVVQQRENLHNLQPLQQHSKL